MQFVPATGHGPKVTMCHEMEIGPGCWIKDYPQECAGPFSEIDCKSPMIAWIFGGTIVLFVIISLITNNMTLYCHVRSTISRSQQRSTVRALEQNSHTQGSSENTTSQVTTNPSKKTSSSDDSKTQRIRAVTTQAFLYVGGFLLAYFWTLVIRIMEGIYLDGEDEGWMYPLLILQSLCAPIQGFFNLLVYVRPQYVRVRRQFPSESRWWSFRRALLGDSVQRPQRS